MAQTTKKNIGKSVLVFFIVLIIIIIAGIIVTSLVFKNSDVTPSFMGYSVYIMEDDGMGQAVPKGSLVIAKNYSPSAENIGDAVLCENVNGLGTTVLRLSNIVPNTETVIYQCFFDNDHKTVYNVTSKNLIGHAVSYHDTFGKIISFVISIKGKAILVVVPLLIMLLAELIIFLVQKQNNKSIKKDKLKSRLDQYKLAENSPLSPQKIKTAPGSGPVTIEDFIFGNDEQGLRDEDSPTLEIKNEKPNNLEKSVEKLKRERAKLAYGENNKETTGTVKLERVRVVHAKKAENEKNLDVKINAVPSVEEEKPLEVREVKEETPLAEETKTVEETPAVEEVKVTEAVETAEEVKEEIKEDKTEQAPQSSLPDNSLERLIKLMEENEKLLKSIANKD